MVGIPHHDAGQGLFHVDIFDMIGINPHGAPREFEEILYAARCIVRLLGAEEAQHRSPEIQQRLQHLPYDLGTAAVFLDWLDGNDGHSHNLRPDARIDFLYANSAGYVARWDPLAVDRSTQRHYTVLNDAHLPQGVIPLVNDQAEADRINDERLGPRIRSRQAKRARAGLNADGLVRGNPIDLTDDNSASGGEDEAADGRHEEQQQPDVIDLT